MSDEWGPWIEHDGKSQPANGLIVHRVFASGSEWISPMGETRPSRIQTYDGPCFSSSWIWGVPGNKVPVIRYRIRKPRGLTILEAIAAKPPKEPIKRSRVPA